MQDRAPDGGTGTPPPELSTLSRREREVLDAALEGLSARDIARRLSLAEPTVRSHLSAIYSKLGVAGRVELLARVNGKAHPRPVPDAGIERDIQDPRHRWRNPSFLALLTVLAISFAAIGALAITLTSLRGSDLAKVSQLIGSNSITHLDLSGSTLTVTETNGNKLQVEAVTIEDFQPIQMAAVNASIAVTVSSGRQSAWVTDIAMLGTLMIPVGLLLLLVLLLRRHTWRPPPLPSSSQGL